MLQRFKNFYALSSDTETDTLHKLNRCPDESKKNAIFISDFFYFIFFLWRAVGKW